MPRPDRIRVLGNIDVTLSEAAGLPIAEVRFASLEGDSVVLRVACAARPDPARGGLTDPGSHAIGSSLPLMWR